MFIKNKNQIGEIIKIKKNKLLVNASDSLVSGFSMYKSFDKFWVKKNKCDRLDEGLNSPFKINFKKFKRYYEERFGSFSPRFY